jgi:hypothetical protein
MPPIPWLVGTAFKKPKSTLFVECGPWVISITVCVSCCKPSHNNGLHSNGLLSQDMEGSSIANSLWTMRIDFIIRMLQKRSLWNTLENVLRYCKMNMLKLLSFAHTVVGTLFIAIKIYSSYNLKGKNNSQRRKLKSTDVNKQSVNKHPNIIQKLYRSVCTHLYRAYR